MNIEKRLPEVSKAYHKRIGLSTFDEKGVDKLIHLINLLGYTQNIDYKVNHYSNSQEMIILNRQLHKDLKLIRHTTYIK